MNSKTPMKQQKMTSQWLKPEAISPIHYELELAQNNSQFPMFAPKEPYLWILKNKGKGLLFRSLDRFAPVFPVIAYQKSAALWVSPPPSGAGNVVGIIMGRDKTNALRVVGSNYLTEPESRTSHLPTSNDFFDQYDQGDRLTRERLLQDTICASIGAEHVWENDYWLRTCQAFNTMPIYLVALTHKRSLLGIAPAQLDGIRPFDLSREYMGEVK